MAEDKNKLWEMDKINNVSLKNILYDPSAMQFYVKGKKRVYIEVDDIRPIPWKCYKYAYEKKDGSISNYEHKYVSLDRIRLSEKDLLNAQFEQNEDKKYVIKPI
jgi:hypothetical protein